VREEDKELRRKLLQLHNKGVADCTNVERKVLQLMEGGCQMPIGVYCEKDSIGNYHVWAALAAHASAPLKMVNLSSSTRYELAEQTVAALKTA
jgi:hydroxymethylbilane synthase